MAGDKIKGLKGASIPRLAALRSNPKTASILSLLTPEDNKKKEPKRATATRGNYAVQHSTLERISKITSTSIDANRELVENVPGAIKTLQILTAAILSPRDLTSMSMNYSSIPYEGKNNDLSALLIAKTKATIEGNYKITDKLRPMLADILMYTGSYVSAIISSSALDNVINGHVKASMEALSDEYRDGRFVPGGYLGDNNAVHASSKRGQGLEAMLSGDITPGYTDATVVCSELGIEVVDNDAILRMPSLKLAITRQRLADTQQSRINRAAIAARGTGMEALGDGGMGKNKGKNTSKISQAVSLNPEQFATIYNELFKQRDYVQTEQVTLPRDDQLTRTNVGAPLFMQLPSESVIPVHLPGNSKVRVGYFVLLDDDGNPVRTSRNDQYYQDQEKNSQDTYGAIDGTKGIIEIARSYKEGKRENIDMTEFRKKFDEEVDRDLVERLANGVYQQTMSIGMSDETRHVMFSRCCRNLKTKVLYLPEEAVSYMAFDYNDMGIGRSLMDRSRLYASMAMANVIATTLANIAASTNVTKLNIPLNENDPDPDETVEAIVTTHLNGNRSLSSLLGARNPRDVCNVLDEASVVIQTSGHPAYPDVNVDVSHEKRNITGVDTEWNNQLLEMLAAQWGVRPELVTSNTDIRFAVEHINNDALFRKDTDMQRQMFSNMLSDLARKLAYKDGGLMDELYEIIMTNKSLWKPSSKKGRAEYAEFKKTDPELAADSSDEVVASRILANFINSLTVELPQSSNGDQDTINRDYSSKREYFEMTIKDVFTDEILAWMMEGTSAEQSGITDKFEQWRGSLVSHMMRQWMADNGSYSDIMDVAAIGDDTNHGTQMLNDMVTYNKNRAAALADYLKTANKAKGDIDKLFKKLVESGGMDNDPLSGITASDDNDEFSDNSSQQFDSDPDDLSGDANQVDDDQSSLDDDAALEDDNANADDTVDPGDEANGDDDFGPDVGGPKKPKGKGGTKGIDDLDTWN